MYYTYEGDNLVLAEDPPDATYVSRGAGEDGTTRYYIYDSAGRGVGSTTQSPPPGTRRAAPDAINEEGLLDVSRAHQAYADGSWQKAAEYAMGAQAENVISELTKVNPNYDWTASIKQAADQLNAAYGSDWQSPNRGSPGGVVAGILQTPAAQSDPAISNRVSQVLPYFKNKQHQDDVKILAEQSTHSSEGDMQRQFLTSVLGGALGGYFGGAESTLPAGVGGIDSGSMSQILGNGAYGPGGAFAPGMVDVMGGTESAMANTAAQTPAISYPVSTPPTLQDLNATDITNYGPANTGGNIAGKFDFLGGGYDLGGDTGLTQFNSAPVEVSPGAYDLGGDTGLTQPTGGGNTAAQTVARAAGAAATVSGVGATQAAGAGLTAAQLLSGASTAVGAGSLLSSFMDSVSSNPIMKALQAGQGIAGIISGMTSTQGMISPEQARAMADPFASSRQQYIDQLNALMANPSLTTSTPGYQFNLQQGLAGIEAKQAKSGVSRTGAGDVAVQQYGQQQAMSSFDQQVKNLSGLSGAGVNPAQGATAALTAQNQKVSQTNAGWQAIGQGIGGVGQSLARGVGATQPGGYSIINPDANTDYTQGYDPNSASMQPMGGYIADPTTTRLRGEEVRAMADPQNLWGA